ncbi:sugar transferase [Paraeggerthella sp. LCP19S3_G8]|uniref:sugar transferase n=1 Tax=Paraeggerthella sp. LCP19S3_G8 TaxID=3440248 RepID=UPI003F9A091B
MTKGMSVIGPRPITQDELEWFGENATEYLSVPMGITGLWQATSRNGASFESGERQRIDGTNTATRLSRPANSRSCSRLFAATAANGRTRTAQQCI